ncbi:MAG: hypothetical protein J7M25_17105 [Deltaproteobacteria bacterium]|nr:hypothetical protein [Deltaproteobacteria bacterium]
MRTNGVQSTGRQTANQPESQMQVMKDKQGKLHLYASSASDKIIVSSMRDGRVSVQVNGEQKIFTRQQAKNMVLHAGGGNDTIAVGPGVPQMTIKGEDGQDQILNFGSHVRLDGGKGNDLMVDFGSHNHLLGGSGNDTFMELGSQNRLEGNSGRDEFVSVGSQNQLTGGRGRDRYVVLNGDNKIRGGHGDRAVRMYRHMSGAESAAVQGRVRNMRDDLLRAFYQLDGVESPQVRGEGGREADEPRGTEETHRTGEHQPHRAEGHHHHRTGEHQPHRADGHHHHTEGSHEHHRVQDHHERQWAEGPQRRHTGTHHHYTTISKHKAEMKKERAEAKAKQAETRQAGWSARERMERR